MENKYTNIPTKIENQTSFMNLIRKLLNRTSKATDVKGKVKYISYPPKKGFSDKQKRGIKELEINDIPIVGENRDTSLRDLIQLKKITLGRDVIAVAEGAIPSIGVECLELSDTVKQIPPYAITNSQIKRVQGNDFCIASKSGQATTDIYIDTDYRLHYIKTGRFSSGQEEYITAHGEDPKSQISIASHNASKDILQETGNFENKDTLYIYDDGNFSREYVVHAMLDQFPIPDSRSKTFSDDKLIGILINGKEEIDLSQLSKYPNLQNIFVGKDVKKVIGSEELEDTDVINEKDIRQRVQKSISGKKQVVDLLSKDTVILKDFPKGAYENQKQKSVEKESEISLDD